MVARNFVGASFARSPNLRRNVLNDFGLPIVKPTRVPPNIISNGMGKAQVKSAKIDADNCIGLAAKRQSQEFQEMSTEPGQPLYHFPYTRNRISRQVERQFDPGSSHSWTASAEKARLEAGVKGLIICRCGGSRIGDLLAQLLHKFSSEFVPAGLAGNHHEALRFQNVIFSRWICAVISNARSSASFADSPLTIGVRPARAHSMKCFSSDFNGSSFAMGTGSRTMRLPAN